MHILQIEAEIILRDPDDAGLIIALLATAGFARIKCCQRRDTGCEIIRDAVLELVGVEIKIVETRVELHCTPATLAEWIEHLGAVPCPVLIAARFTRQEITDFSIGAEKGRVARWCYARTTRERVTASRDIAGAIGAHLGPLRFTRNVQRLENAGEFEPENIVTLGGEASGIDKADIGRLQQWPRAITAELVGRRRIGRGRRHTIVVRLEFAMLPVESEMELTTQRERRESKPRCTNPAIIVDRRIDRVRGKQARAPAQRVRAVLKTQIDAKTTRVAERIIHLRAFHEAQEARAAHLLKTVVRFLITDDQRPWLILGRIGQHDIAEADDAVVVINFSLIAEIAWHRAFDADAETTNACVKAKVAVGDIIIGFADQRGIEHEATADLEAPASRISQLRSALPCRQRLGELLFDIIKLRLKRRNLCFEQRRAGIGRRGVHFFSGNRQQRCIVGRWCVGGWFGFARNRRSLSIGVRRERHCARPQQNAKQGDAFHWNNPF